MKLVVVGGVAAGASLAARARRLDEFAEIIESLGATEVISSSKNAFDDIVAAWLSDTSSGGQR